MHYTTQRFWKCYDALPEVVQRVADQNYELLKTDPSHPSLHFKKVGQYWLSGAENFSSFAGIWLLTKKQGSETTNLR